MTTEHKLTAATPAALPDTLRARLLGAMTEAAEEERLNRETEDLLRRLSPAPLPPRFTGRAGVRMCLAAADERSKHRTADYGRTLMWHRFAAAASLLLFAVGGAGVLTLSNASADTAQGLMSRSVLDTRAESIEWQDGAPVRCYTVTYEDEFVMDADEDMTVMVRVPSRTKVQVEEEIL